MAFDALWSMAVSMVQAGDPVMNLQEGAGSSGSSTETPGGLNTHVGPSMYLRWSQAGLQPLLQHMHMFNFRGLGLLQRDIVAVEPVAGPPGAPSKQSSLVAAMQRIVPASQVAAVLPLLVKLMYLDGRVGDVSQSVGCIQEP